MTERELRRLSRKDLLEMMIEQKKELEALKLELEEARKALQNREIMLNEAGSIAIAALQINGIFEAAQAAGQQYLENIQKLNERQAAICAKRDADSKAEADRLLKETAERCRELEEEAKQKSDAYWLEVSRRLQSFYDTHQELKQLLSFSSRA
ncbi:MAG TPA: hypothetical protein IAD50_08050 [Candidatus Egerieisoma faecipullorum]|mgnify:CR=1 FL=1|uniref:Uncharacterized protein n=1 Tax=Candidatus Egerieisoma faecipullorum TaxID=2840963 RepID=A0A9D1LAR6_9CLOT|nr:hypothetical protein [Candidatus Egerieisoma faecipullorum]